VNALPATAVAGAPTTKWFAAAGPTTMLPDVPVFPLGLTEVTVNAVV
jgi:hypothetical protein